LKWKFHIDNKSDKLKADKGKWKRITLKQIWWGKGLRSAGKKEKNSPGSERWRERRRA